MNAELLVDGRELKDALKTIRLSDRKLSCGEVAFSFTDGWLELQTQGVSVQIVASETWPRFEQRPPASATPASRR